MKFNDYFESKEMESKEERLGKDLDHDCEKGEPKAHRDKVLSKKDKKRCGYLGKD